MNIGGYNVWALLFYAVLGIVAIIFAYLAILALQAIISIDKTLREMLKLEHDRERKKEEREMRRI
jgi:H+/Cl- antiporter ClcA